MALNVFLPSRKSEEIVTTTPIKIARTEHKNSININKNPAYLDSINKGINSVTIDATSPSTNTRTSHEGNTVNKAIKPKVVKLNRRTLGLNVDKSFEHSLLKDDSRSSLNGGTQKVQSLMTGGKVMGRPEQMAVLLESSYEHLGRKLQQVRNFVQMCCTML